MLAALRVASLAFWVAATFAAYYTQKYILAQIGLTPLGKGGDWEFTFALGMLTGTIILWRISNEISKEISKETERRKMIVAMHDENGGR